MKKKFCSLQAQKKWTKQELFEILNDGIKYGEHACVVNLDYLSLFGIKETSTMQDIWKHLFANVKTNMSLENQQTIDTILTEGTLSTRILNATGNDPSEEKIKQVYFKLADCLETNQLFIN